MRIAVALLATTGCFGDFDFDSPGTTIRASGENGQTHVTICAGPSGLLSCNGEEELTVIVGEEIQPAKTGLFSFGMLEAFFATDAADTPITVVRTRDGAQATGALPAPFTLTATAGTVNDGAIPATWERGTGDPMSWHRELTCGSGTYFSEEHSLDDDGAARFPVGDVPDDAEGSCTGAIIVTRTRTGAMHSFETESSMTVEQVRRIGFRIR